MIRGCFRSAYSNHTSLLPWHIRWYLNKKIKIFNAQSKLLHKMYIHQAKMTIKVTTKVKLLFIFDEGGFL